MRNLAKVADTVDDWVALGPGAPILEVWAWGEVLDEHAGPLDCVQAALVVDLAVGDVTWRALPLAMVGLAPVTHLERLPVERAWRPSRWPVWNHAIRRPVLVWDRAGPRPEAMEALASGRGIEAHRQDAPTPALYRRQLETELEASVAHLRRVAEGYWDPEWRFGNRGSGAHPEDHLWRAVQGHLELREAIAELGLPAAGGTA